MSYQETNFFQEFQLQDSSYESGGINPLHLSSTIHQHPTAATAAAELMNKCIACSNSKKRHPLSSSFQEPSKRAILHHPSSPSTTTAAPVNNPLHGFTKLPLPFSFPNASSPPLRRSVSEPIYSPDTINATAPSTQFSGQILNPPLQEGSKINNIEASLPVIHRTISDPTPVSDRQKANASTPPRPPPARNVLKSPSCGESPNTKRLKRVKERLREMNQWWNQVMSEGEEEDGGYEDNNCEDIPKGESETELEKPSEEAVWVEKNGRCLVLHFKCPCGNGYQVLLNGNNCYYKLTNL